MLFSFFLQSEIEKIMHIIAFFTLFAIRNRKNHENHRLFIFLQLESEKIMNIITFFILFVIRNRKVMNFISFFILFANTVLAGTVFVPGRKREVAGPPTSFLLLLILLSHSPPRTSHTHASKHNSGLLRGRTSSRASPPTWRTCHK